MQKEESQSAGTLTLGGDLVVGRLGFGAMRPGTSSVEHLEENVAAAGLRLDAEEVEALTRLKP